MVVGTIVILGITSMYVSMARYGVEMDHQADLQQQGTLLQENLARRIQPAVSLFPGACGATANSLGIVYSDATKNVCIYQEQNGTEILECRLPDTFPVSTACTSTPATLLPGARAIITANSLRFDCKDPPVCTTAYETGGTWVDVQFGLSAAIGVRPVVFGTRVTLRNS